MNPSRKESSSPSRTEAQVGELITEPTDYDVMLGRGAVSHKGNIHFRQIISGRRGEYLSISKRQQKDWIARQVMSAVAKKGGRFLKRIESLVEGEQFGVPAGKIAWRVVDEATALLKVKQALRERDSEQVHKRQMEEPSPRPTKKHQPDRSLQRSAGLDTQQSHARSEPSSMEVPPQSSIAGVATGASSTQETGLFLGAQYEQVLQQFRNIQASSLTPDIMRPQEPPLLGTSFQRLSSLYPNRSIYPDDSDQGRRALAQHWAPTHDLSYGNLGRSSSTASVDNLFALLSRYRQPSDIPPAVASVASSILASQVRQQAPQAVRQDSDPSALQINQATAGSDSAFAPSSDRLQALLTALQEKTNTTQSVSGDRPIFSREEERISPRRPPMGDVYNAAHQPQQPSGLTIPNFFPRDLQAETKGMVALFNSTSLDHKAQGGRYLSFSLTEMMILAVLCSFGIPTWSSSRLDRNEVFSPIKKSNDGPSMYQISWYEFSLLLHQAAKDWRDRRNQPQTLPGILAKIQSELMSDLDNCAVGICASYMSDCRKLAKTTLCILEKVRCFLKAMRGETTGASQKTTVPATDDRSELWMEKEIKLWAETLDCQTANRFPVAYTASDFLFSHPEHKENSVFKLVSQCDLEISQIIWDQIVVLSHTRSMATGLTSVNDLSVRLERSLMSGDAQSWERMPRWWSLNSLYFDTELLKIMLLNGYVGVLTASLSSPLAAASISAEPMTFAKLGITSKRLLQERFEQLAGFLAKTEDNGEFLEQLQEPRNQKCLEERIQDFRNLA